MTNAPGRPRVPRRLRWRHRWTIRLVLVAAALAVLAFLAAANYVLVDLRLIGWRGDVRLSWALLGAVVFGFLAGFASSRLLR